MTGTQGQTACRFAEIDCQKGLGAILLIGTAHDEGWPFLKKSRLMIAIRIDSYIVIVTIK